MLWWSDRSGWGHLYLLDGTTGGVKTTLTSGEWVVDSVVGLTEEKVFFTATGRDGGEVARYLHQLYSVRLDGSDLSLLTAPAAGEAWLDHSAFGASAERTGGSTPVDNVLGEGLWKGDGSLSPSGEYLVASSSSQMVPPATSAISAVTGAVAAVLETADISKLLRKVPGGPPPVIPFVKMVDGVPIHGNIHRPSHFDPSISYPVIDTIYPGPQIGRATRRFEDCYFNSSSGWGGQALAELGFVIVTLDCRGTPLRSKAFHAHRCDRTRSSSSCSSASCSSTSTSSAASAASAAAASSSSLRRLTCMSCAMQVCITARSELLELDQAAGRARRAEGL